MNGLHVEVLGEGPPVLLVHGSFGTARGTFGAQRPLSDEHRLVFVDRRGFGASPDADELGWPVDMHDLATLLDEVGAANLIC